MAETQGKVVVDDPTALEELARSEELQQQALRVDEEISRLLAPLRRQLGALVMERDRLSYETQVARQKFFRAAKKGVPSLADHGSLRFEKKGGKVYIYWDDTGPRFSEAEGSELPQLQTFARRGPGRRAVDFLFRVR